MRLALILCLLFSGLTIGAAFAADPIQPDPKLTPGAVLTTDAARVCKRDYAKSVRHTSLALKREVYDEYGIEWVPGGYEIDHLIPLGIGGADVKENLWPQSHHTPVWNAETKDRLEWKLHKLVCSHRLDIQEAQRAVATDWIAAYKRFCPHKRDCPAYDEDVGRLKLANGS
jgi:hypothetical protein